MFYVNMWPMNRILVICGPTATGKSALAVELAKQYNGEVISADSRQVYTGLDIGSAKITESEMDGIPHYLIDVVHPNDYFSVADFQKLAKEEINDIHSRGKLPIICGGTGMYIDALIYETNFPEVPANEPLRSELANLTNEELYAELQKLDPDRASEIDPHNSVRLIRAIEIATTLGSVPKITTENPQYETLWIGLDIPKEELEGKIKKRILDRIPALFEEINNLHLSGVSFERLESFGLEYRYGSYYVQEKITLEEFKDLLATKTWQYAKRQMTWFKRNKNIHWCNPIIDKQKILKLVQDFLRLNNN